MDHDGPAIGQRQTAAGLKFRHGAQGWSVRDVGSLNGTYVNRRRIESHKLEEGDELQIGKYKLTYLAR